MASYCLTEPGSGSGKSLCHDSFCSHVVFAVSDAASLQTKVVKDGNHYILNGTKVIALIVVEFVFDVCAGVHQRW